MNEIIVTGGRSHSKTYDEILKSEEYKSSIEKLKAAGFSSAEIEEGIRKLANIGTNPEVKRLFDNAGKAVRELSSVLLKIKNSEANINHVNPSYRQYKRSRR